MKLLALMLVMLAETVNACYFVRLFYSDGKCQLLNETLTAEQMKKTPPGTCRIFEVAGQKYSTKEECDKADDAIKILGFMG